MQITVTELQETVVSFKKLCILLVTLVLLSQMGLLYYMSAVNSSLIAAVDDDRLEVFSLTTSKITFPS